MKKSVSFFVPVWVVGSLVVCIGAPRDSSAKEKTPPATSVPSEKKKREPAAATEAKEKPASPSTKTYGAPLSSERKPIALSAVLESPDSFVDQIVVVDAKVRAACTKRGCWMELAESAEKGVGPSCRVTFKDYGFFVPTDSAGAKVRVEGVVQVKKVASNEVAHLEAEGGSFVKAADGTAREVRIVATGVELTR